MYIYTPLCRYWIALYRYVLVFIVPHVDIELEDNKQFISNIPRIPIISITIFSKRGYNDEIIIRMIHNKTKLNSDLPGW